MTQRGTHWVVRLNGRNRGLFFLAVLAVLALHLQEQPVGALQWTLMALQFAVYPHLIYWRAVRSVDPLRAELQNLLLDGLLMGAWIAVWGMPLWISFMLFIAVSLNVVIYSGMPGLLKGWLSMAVGVAAVGLASGIDFRPDTRLAVSLLCIGLLTLYLLFFANAAYHRGVSLRDSRKALGEQLEQITELQAKLQEQVRRDPLTGLYNRRHADTVMAHELVACGQADEPLAVVLLDIDHFKRINDTWGHLAGDDLLCALAAQLRAAVGGRAMACRLGGDELMLMLPGAGMEAAARLAEQLRTRFEQEPLVADGQPMRATLSLGIAMFPDHGENARDLLLCADHALYQAKLRGRNQVVRADAPAGAARLAAEAS